MRNLPSFLSDNFFLTIPLLFLLGKIFLKQFLHSIAIKKIKVDNWQAYAWLSVDLALISLTLSITVNYPDIVKFSYERRIWWYIELVACVVFICTLYTQFIKRRGNSNFEKPTPLNDIPLFFITAMLNFFSVVPYVTIINELKK